MHAVDTNLSWCAHTRFFHVGNILHPLDLSPAWVTNIGIAISDHKSWEAWLKLPNSVQKIKENLSWELFNAETSLELFLKTMYLSSSASET